MINDLNHFFVLGILNPNDPTTPRSHEMYKQDCLKGIFKRIAQFLIIQGDNQIAVPFVLVMEVSQLYRLKLHNLDPVQ